MDELYSIINFKPRQTPRTEDLVQSLGIEHARKVRSFHETLPGYGRTELVSLDKLAAALELKNIYIKDESTRMGLNAFKVLGGSYVIAKLLGEKLGLKDEELTMAALQSPEAKAKLGQPVFITVTDGNHGRGIAWMAQQLGYKAIVMMPEGTVQERVDNIAKLGAEVSVSDCNYDDTIRRAAAIAQEKGYYLVQDTAWEGYEEVPLAIMQGYGTMALEALEQLEEAGNFPTHVFLQAGVGAMSSSVAACIVDYCQHHDRELPRFILVEPTLAGCCFATAQADDGQRHFVTGSMSSMMAGLCCGEPCTLAWEILQAYVSCFTMIEDQVAARGMYKLAHPLYGDRAIVSGESGAAGFAMCLALMENLELEPWRRELQLDKDAVVLCFSTEGDTDKANYARIVNQ